MRSASRSSRAWATALLALSACGGVKVADQALPPDLAWPPGDPRVRLERIIAARKGGGALRALLGASQGGLLFERPYAVAWDGDDLLVADSGAGKVVRIESDGQVRAPGAALGAPVGVAVCAQGVVVTDPEGGRIARLGADLGVVDWVAEGLNRPTGLACRGESLYVVETGAHRVLVFDADGRRRVVGQRGPDPGSFNFPTTIGFAGGSLLVGDTLNFRVQRIDIETGAVEDMFGQLGDSPGEMPRIKGLAVDAAGQVWVSDAHTDRVSLYTSDGRLLLTLGGRGVDPGRFSFPAGIAAHPDGRVAVADSFNRRIQVFRVVGGELSRK